MDQNRALQECVKDGKTSRPGLTEKVPSGRLWPGGSSLHRRSEERPLSSVSSKGVVMSWGPDYA